MNATLNPIDRAAEIRMKKQGIPTIPGLPPILNLVWAELVPEGQEESQEALLLAQAALDGADVAANEVEDMWTPQEILTEPLEDLAQSVMIRIRLRDSPDPD